MAIDDIKITIGLDSQEINGDTPLNLFIENTTAHELLLSVIAKISLTGGLNGWANLDFLSHEARTPFSTNPINFHLSPGQNIFSKIKLSKLLFADEKFLSASPSLNWFRFVSNLSPVNSDVSLQCSLEIIQSGTNEKINSNILHTKIDLSNENKINSLLSDIQNMSLMIQQLNLQIANLERSHNP